MICAIGYGRMFERIVRASRGFWSQFGPPLGAMILAIGLICWLYDRPLLNVWVWRGVLTCLVLGQLLAIVFAAYLVGMGIYVPAALMISISVVLIPAYIALHQYSYRSSEIWNGT